MGDLWHEERLYIDGELVDAEGGATYENINPATEEVLGVAADASVGDIDRAIAAARRAFDETGWATDVDLRVRCLRQLHTALLDNLEEIRATTVAEVGTPGRADLRPPARRSGELPPLLRRPGREL